MLTMLVDYALAGLGRRELHSFMLAAHWIRVTHRLSASASYIAMLTMLVDYALAGLGRRELHSFMVAAHWIGLHAFLVHHPHT